MRSIRTQLVGTLVSGVLLVSVGAAAGLYAYTEEVMEHGLDATLAAKAEAIAGAVHMEDDGRPHLRSADVTGAAAHRGDTPFLFQVWRADGRTLARVALPAAGSAPLRGPPIGRKRFADVRLADGTVVRTTALSFVARPDEDEYDAVRDGPATRPSERLTLVVCHDRAGVDGPLAVLLTGLLLAAAVLVAGILATVTWGVRRGLRPLAAVSDLADRIGPDALDVRFPAGGDVPAELRPIGAKLNDLLDRLQEAFARERRFSAAVAHELRTPLAELRAACEVALRWPDDREAATAALTEAGGIAVEMGDMVQTLLTLARTRAKADPVRLSDVDLSAAVTEAWEPLRVAAAERRLTAELDVPPDAPPVPADPVVLAAVLRNLLGNAVEHATAGGRVGVRATTSADVVTLHVGNTTDALTPADLPRLFEPFWQKSAARTGGTHVGLGLTLVEAYCRATGVTVRASIDPPEWFDVALSFPVRPEGSAKR